MFLLIILPILVSGFLVCHTHPFYKYKLHRYEGQYLYLKSAALGSICLIISTLIVLGLNKFIPDKIIIFNLIIDLDIHKIITELFSELGTLNIKESSELSWVLSIITISLIVPYIWSILATLKYCIRYVTLSPKEQINGSILADSPMDNFLFNASLQKGNHLVMLTLSDRKVYVGKVLNLGEPNESEGLDQEVTLKPVVSGTRDSENLKVTFNTHYNGLDEETYLIIRQDMIVSACEFNFDTYEKLNLKKNKWVPLGGKES